MYDFGIRITDPGETKTSIILGGLEKELRERYMKKNCPANERITKKKNNKVPDQNTSSVTKKSFCFSFLPFKNLLFSPLPLTKNTRNQNVFNF